MNTVKFIKLIGLKYHEWEGSKPTGVLKEKKVYVNINFITSITDTYADAITSSLVQYPKQFGSRIEIRQGIGGGTYTDCRLPAELMEEINRILKSKEELPSITL